MKMYDHIMCCLSKPNAHSKAIQSTPRRFWKQDSEKQTENEEGPETPEGVSKTNHKGRHWLCLLLLVGQPLFVFMSGAERGRSRMEFMEKPKEPILNFLWNAIEWGVARTQRETMDGGGTQTGAGRGGGADEKGEWVGEELKIKGKENNQ